MIDKCLLEQAPRLEIEHGDLADEADSTVPVRNRVRRSL